MWEKVKVQFGSEAGPVQSEAAGCCIFPAPSQTPFITPALPLPHTLSPAGQHLMTANSWSNGSHSGATEGPETTKVL